EALLAARVRAARAALVAAAARDQRIDGDAVARGEAPHVGPDALHDGGALVAHDPGLGEHLIADAARPIIVQIGPADADRAEAQAHVARARELGVGHVARRELARRGQVNG